MREPITDAELEQWAKVRADDAGHLARELLTYRQSAAIPADIIETLRAIGPVEWGRSFEQTDEQHVADFVDTLRITREHFGTVGETEIHGVYLAGTNTVLAHTGSSPNSPQHARILVGAWNHLVEQAKVTTDTSGAAFRQKADVPTAVNDMPEGEKP